MSRTQQVAADEDDPLLTLAEVMQHLGYSHDTLTRRINAGKIPFVRSGADRRRKLVRKSDLDAYVAQASQNADAA